MSKDFSHITGGVMIYNSAAQYTIISHSDLLAAEAAGWSTTPPQSVTYESPQEYPDILEFPATESAVAPVSSEAPTDPAEPEGPKKILNKAELLAFAKEVHGLELSGKLTKPQIVVAIDEAIAAKSAA